MNAPVIHLVGQRPAPELAALAGELRSLAVVYHFATTREMIAAWRLAQTSDAGAHLAPMAVVWLQSRPGEFRQREIDVVAECDPLARPILIAGCWSEGEPRSGKPLTGVTRAYWHQGIGAIVPIATRQAVMPTTAAQWLAIHTPQFIDYQGIAAACQSLGLQTIWQNDRWPAISSEPALRLFVHWETWQAWRERSEPVRGPRAKEIVLLSYPRPADFQRAAESGIGGVLAQPFTVSELQRVILTAKKEPQPMMLPFVSPPSRTSNGPVVRQLQSA